ncbi:ATP-binding protein [Exilibacterium tricleocarpae]|uniref:ATP-binding protein n=1 Tax=Exilibacterium tricleocarpae TaxID=2591008 RepID=UPI0015D3873B|nr:ATP-binding protein [Exilibacterium tricleocarpae]
MPADHYLFDSLQPPSINVRKIFKDTKGFIWLGSASGLARFDGYDFRDYTYDAAAALRLSNLYVEDIVEDPFQRLWIATHNGLNRLDLKTEKITHYFHSSKSQGTIGDNHINSLLLDKKRLLVTTVRGLDAIDLQSGAINNVLQGYNITQVYKGAGDSLWLGTRENGLLHYREHTGQLKHYTFSTEKLGSANEITAIVSLDDHLWLLTGGGLIKFNPRTQRSIKQATVLQDKQLTDITIDKNHHFWITTRGHGLYRYFPGDGTVQQFNAYPNSDNSLGSNNLATLFFDAAENRLWIGHYSVNSIDLSLPVFMIRHHLPNRVVWGANLSNNNQFLISTAGGLSIYHTQSASHENHTGIKPVFDAVGTDNKVWMTSSTGFFMLDRETGQITNLTSAVEPLREKSTKNLSYAMALNPQEFLLSSRYGLIKWNTHSQQAALYQTGPSPQQRRDSDTTNIHLYKGTVIVGTAKGLYYLTETGVLAQYNLETHTTPLDDAVIFTAAADDNHVLWVGSSQGLFKLKDRRIVAHYTSRHGLSNNKVYDIAIRGNRLWAGGEKGLAAFRIGDREFNQIQLDSDLFTIGINTCRRPAADSRYLYFCTPEGLLYFAPDILAKTIDPLTTRITGLRLFNRPVAPGSKALPQAIETTDQLTLDYRQNMLSFEFSALNYSNTNHLYAYQMLGVTQNQAWISTNAQNRVATFTLQKPGNYTFRVKAGWSEQDWSPEITELKITVLPPWWQTRWASVSYILLLLSIVFSFYKLRTRTLRLRAAELEKQVYQRTEEVTRRKDQLQRRNKKISRQKQTIEHLLATKNELFANISHELRTPLTLIRGPISRAIENLNTAAEKNALRIAERNTDRLTALVEQLLMLSRLQQFDDVQKPRLQRQSVSDITDQLCQSFQSIADSQRLDFDYHIQTNIHTLACDQALEEMIVNLLANAFKYTPGGNSITATLSRQGKTATISVKDTGVGIPHDQLGSIFERFARLPRGSGQSVEGVGLGLALVKQLVDLHCWQLHVESEPGVGSEFQVHLPVTEIPAPPPLSTPTTLAPEIQQQIDYLGRVFTHRNDTTRSPNKPSPASGAKRRLLIIDDTPDMLCYLAELLQQDFSCECAESGATGITMANQHPPDLVICDVMMPGLSGFDVLDQLRENLLTAHIPVLMLTAKGDKESRLTGLNKLADDYITKPFDGNELRARLHAMWSLQRRRQESLKEQLLEQQPVSTGSRPMAGLTPRDRVFIEKWETAIEDNYTDINTTVEKLARCLHISPGHLLDKLKALIGKGPKEFLNEYRINKAKHLLLTAPLSIADIAEAVGFKNHRHFSTSFKRITRTTPTAYRKRHSTTVARDCRQRPKPS